MANTLPCRAQLVTREHPAGATAAPTARRGLSCENGGQAGAMRRSRWQGSWSGVPDQFKDAIVARKGSSPKPSIRSSSFDSLDLLGPKRLTARDRAHLATISTRLRVRSGTTIFERGDAATAVYNIVSGSATSFRPLAKETRRVMAFLFPEDIFGLSRGGRYVNTVHALTPLTLFRIPLDSLKTMLLRNPQLQLHFLCKVTHALREAQRHAVLVGVEEPLVRVARFLTMIEQAQPQDTSDVVHLPMTRRDIGDYLNLTADGVVDALGELTRRRMIAFDGAHDVRIVDRRLLTTTAKE
jgi:CRP-like cAMP-binding protein